MCRRHRYRRGSEAAREAVAATSTAARAARHSERHGCGSGGDDGPGGALVGSGVEPHDEEAEAERRDGPGPTPLRAEAARGGRLPGERHDAGERRARFRSIGGRGKRALRGVDRERHDRRGSRDRRHDAHGADREPAVEGGQADDPATPAPTAGSEPPTPGNAITGTSTQSRTPTSPIACEIGEDDEDGDPRDASPPRKSPTPQHEGAAEREQRGQRRQSSPTGRVAACASSWFAW